MRRSTWVLLTGVLSLTVTLTLGIASSGNHPFVVLALGIITLCILCLGGYYRTKEI